MNAIDASSADKMVMAAAFQIATGPVQFAVSEGMRASKYQTNQ